MRINLLLYSYLLIPLLSGCVGSVAGDINQTMQIRRSSTIDTNKIFDESKIGYIKELRCYTYGANEKKEDIGTFLFDSAGKKIMTRDEAIEQTRFHYSENNFSTSEQIGFFATAVWAVPVGIVFGVAENLAMLPAYPYVFYLKNKFEKETYEYYQAGEQLLEQGNYPEAREKFLHALSGWGSLIYYSDIYYKIAETYDKQGHAVLSKKYYRIFLEYSISMYPEYFKEYNPKLTNDRNKLDQEFTSAEEKLNKMITRRSRRDWPTRIFNFFA